MKKFVLLILGLFFCTVAPLYAQSFEATVNRNKIPEGETFLLTLELSGARTNSSPDLSKLNTDFTTYSVSSAYQTNIINGKVSQSQQWNLVLMPNKTGSLTIPSLELEGHQSKPITIEVTPAGSELSMYDTKTTPEGEGNRFAMSGSVDNKTPYVQEQIIYTLKLTDRGGLQGEEPYFEAADSQDWIIKSLGAPTVNSQVINGRTIRELVFKYALFPQKSGKLTIPAAKFRGFYLTKKSRKDPFADFFHDDIFLSGFGMTDVFAAKNPVALSTKPISVDIKPAASQDGSWWLPASKVKLQAEFDGGKPDFRVGEAVTRTFYLQATGIIDSQMPEINFPEINGLKQYPEKPEVVMKVEDGQIVSIAKIANVYIPSQNGNMTLPAVSMPWFNVKTNRMETAQIPAQQITVGGQAIQAPIIQQTPTKDALQTEIVETLPESRIYWLLGAAFVLGILLSAAVMKLFARGAKEPKPHPLRDIRRAAQDKDLRRLRDALLLWAKERYPHANIFSLKDVEDIVQNQAFTCELEKLGEALYAAKEAEWNSAQFIKTFEKINKMKVKKHGTDDLLPKLYK